MESLLDRKGGAGRGFRRNYSCVRRIGSGRERGNGDEFENEIWRSDCGVRRGGHDDFWLSLPLLTIAAGLISLAQEPKGTEAFFANVPYGSNVLAFLEKVDAFLSA